MAVVDGRSSIVYALIGLGAVAAVPLLRPRILTAALTVTVFALIYGTAELWYGRPVGLQEVVPLALDFLFMVVTLAAIAAVAVVSGKYIRGLADEVHFREAVINELTQRDPDSLAFKPQYAGRMLHEEIERSRRYRRPLAFVVVAIEDWEGLVRQRGSEEMVRSLCRLSEISSDNLRYMDKLCRHGLSQFSLLLPETPLAGAQIVAERIIRQGEAALGFTLRAGVVEFPSDGDDAESLTREADSAVALASSIGLPMASRALLAR
jgi:GGDEF domain-containing protein